MKHFLEKHYRLIMILVLGYTLTVSVLNAANDSLIYDEDAHIPAGYSYLREHDMRLNPEHPPLLKDIAALPLLIINPVLDTTKPFWNENANDAQWDAGKYFLFGAGNNPDEIIFLSRLPFVLIYMLLALFIFKWARELGGITAGLIAFLLFALDPNILGHNHYVTTDLGIAAFMVPVFYFFLKFVRNPSWKNTFIFGLVWGALQLVKFSSVLTFPIFGLILIVYPLVKLNASGEETHGKEKWKFLGGYVGKGLLAFVVSLALVWVVYFLNTYQMPPEKLPEIASHYLDSGQSNIAKVYIKKMVDALNGPPAIRPLAVYFFGVARVFQRVAGGNVTYFFGQVNTQGFFAYFPAVFLIKTPLASLFLILCALSIGLFKGSASVFHHFQDLGNYFKTVIRNRITGLTLLSFMALYLLSSILGRLNIGIRHLFPIFPLIFILTALAITNFIRKVHNRNAKYTSYFSLAFLFLFLLVDIYSAYPYYMSYFNQAAGGPKNGYHFITDSNADWGQDLKRLSLFLDQHPEMGKLKLNYFGMADQTYYLDGRYEFWWDAKRPIEPGWYGISTLFLQQSLYNQSLPDNQSYRWLQNKKPLYQVGTSILIYHVSAAEANAANNQGL